MNEHTETGMDRRRFIGRSGAALTGILGSSMLERSDTHAQPREKIVGCYSSVNEILDQPKYIDALQRRLGVNLLICGSAIRMPEWLRKMNPLGDAGSMHARHADDDSRLRAAIDEAHGRGMRFQLYFSGHHYGEESRHIMGETFDGVKFIDLPLIKYALAHSEYTACFEKPSVKAWEPALFGYAAKEYDVDSMYVSHHRYATPSFWSNLFGCACTDCRKAADRLGYNFDDMRRAMISLRTRLSSLDRKTVEHIAASSLTFSDFLSFLGDNDGVMDWLYFRAGVVGESLRRIHDAVHLSSAERSTFVTDTHCPTMAVFVGHNYEDLINGCSDALHPLTWAQWQYVSVIAAWANQLCEWVDGLGEPAALNIVTRFFGWEDIGLPTGGIADLKVEEHAPTDGTYNQRMRDFYASLGPERLVRLMTHEWKRMEAINRDRIPAHPVIKGYEWPEQVCRELMDRSADIGLDGYVFQRTDVLIDRDRL